MTVDEIREWGLMCFFLFSIAAFATLYFAARDLCRYLAELVDVMRIHTAVLQSFVLLGSDHGHTDQEQRSTQDRDHTDQNQVLESIPDQQCSQRKGMSE